MSSSKGGVEADLDGLLRGLKLTEQEKKGVRGAWRSQAMESTKSPQAVGKLFASKPGYAEGLVQTVGRIWCPQKGIRCKELGNNRFLFTFLQPGGKRRALREGPWEFGGDLLVVVDFDESKRLKDLEFTQIPVWIRVFDLPLGLMNAETGRRIGNAVGIMLEVDKDDDELAVGEFLRVKVLIDIRKPLTRGITMEKGEGEGEFWCGFKYEFLPNFCYSCGHLGHVEKECDDSSWGQEGKQFGDWLRVNPVRKKDGRGRGSEGGSSGGSHQHLKDMAWGKNRGTRKNASSDGSRKTTRGNEGELKDDGESPLKCLANEERCGTPRRLEFEHQELATGSVIGELLPTAGVSAKGASTSDLETSLPGAAARPMLAPIHSTIQVKPKGGGEGHTTAQAVGGEQSEGTFSMDVDGKGYERVEGEGGYGDGVKESNKLEVHGEREDGRRGMAVGFAEVLKRATFRRRPRTASGKGKSDSALGDEHKKRSAPEEVEEDVERKKKQCLEAEASKGRMEQNNVIEAGLLGQSRQTK